MAMASREPPYRFKRKFELDSDTLHCPICTEPFSPPVYQCPNGHTACAPCCKKLRKGTCPSCAKPMGSNRNIAVEKILESLLVSCKHAHMGCEEMHKYAHRKEHESRCGYRLCRCPVADCLHSGAQQDLARHIVDRHRSVVQIVQRPPAGRSVSFTMKATDLFVMVEGDHGDDFLVHHEDRKLFVPGDVFFCTALSALRNSYYLTVQVDSKFFAMETLAHDIQREVDWKHDFLLVPRKPTSLVPRQFHIELWLTDQELPEDASLKN